MCSLAAIAVGVAPGRADNWDFQPRAEVGSTYSDNYRMDELPAQRIRVGGAYADAELDAHLIGLRSDFAIEPHIHSTLFPGHSEQQSTDGFLTLMGDFRTVKSTFDGLVQYFNQTIIYSELLPATFPGVQLGQTTPAQSGRVTYLNRQQLERLQPKWSYELSPRRKLQLFANYSRAEYDKNLFEQIGYQNLSALAGLDFMQSLRSSWSVHTTAARFQPDRGGANTTTYGVDGQWNMQYSPIVRFYVRAGVNRSEATLGSRSITSTGTVGGAGVQFGYQVTEFILDAVRSFEPSGFGVVMLQNELRFRVNRNLSPRIKGYVAVRAVDVSGAQSQLTVQRRDYLAGETGVAFQMTRNLRIAAAYNYAWQRFHGEPTATANAATVSLVYQPLSRFQPLPLMAVPNQTLPSH